MSTKKSLLINNYTLRISTTSICNLNCFYCNPNRVVNYKKDMSEKDILDIVQAAAIAGVKKVSWTGGEPTMRPHFLNLVEKTKLLGIKRQSLTTNGIVYYKIADELKKAGINKINFSLDTLNKNKYKEICGFDGLIFVKKSIRKAIKLYSQVKINCVVTKGNIGIIDDFVNFAEQFKGKLLIRFLEVVPCGELYEKDKNIFKDTFTPFLEIKARLEKYGILRQVVVKGDVPKSIYYKISGLKGIYGINPNRSVNYRCDRLHCTKLRVNPRGFVSNCTIKLKYVRDFRNKTLEEKIIMMKKIVKEKSNRNYKSFRHKQKYYDFWRFGITPDFIKKRFG